MTRDTVLGTLSYNTFRPIGTILKMTPQPHLLKPMPAFEFQLVGRLLIIDVITGTHQNKSLGDEWFTVLYPDDVAFNFLGRIKEERS